eukprot:4721971-Amphidinium_carterae.1
MESNVAQVPPPLPQRKRDRTTCTRHLRVAGSKEPSAPMKAQSLKRKASARQRCVPPVQRSQFLQSKVLKPVTVARYTSAVRDFLDFCRQRKLPTGGLVEVDMNMAAYFNHLYFQGLGPSTGRFCLFGWLHLKTKWNGNKSDLLPHALRALRGWNKVAPDGMRDPCPLTVAALLAE